VQRFGIFEFASLGALLNGRWNREKYLSISSIRRATEELKCAGTPLSVSYPKAAFSTNDVDGFELSVKAQRKEHPVVGDTGLPVGPRKVYIRMEKSPVLRSFKAIGRSGILRWS